MNEISTQEELDGVLAELASAFTTRARATVESWRQVPLLAVVANGRSGWSGTLSEAGDHGTWSLAPAGGAGLRVRCSDGAALTWPTGTGGLASPAYVLQAATEHRHALTAWDGAAVLDELVRSASGPIASYYEAADNHRAWMNQVHRHRVGLVTGWEHLEGPLHRVSDTLVKLAGEWEGSFRSLLMSSLALDEGADELRDLAVFDPRLDLDLPCA